ncbi:nucleotidyltransferase domain-containing protein [Vulcanisaeta distributa]|uniref:DNA polymerase beta domain protein region n=1 Tax=Vulcanisaeta distributa (strain DSM 14429 / JCM 11212 / NBRC 100878 / IC-017) TaxID=572478 RepID=E1QUH8_VULDI|nr:nucleotidyltransferase domain-containing protein [Vulcanisaeta distributa]ADN49904.1 DNA polymerase beta domain protein region [Vulcanisaeta distributa DSM 14429]
MGACSEQCLRVLGVVRDIIINNNYKDFIQFAVLYGSLVYGVFGPLSDVDVAVLFRDGVDIVDVLPMLISDLALALGVPEDRVDVAVLNDPLLPFEVRFRALAQGVPVYIGDRGVFIREVVRAISLYGDYQVFLRVNGFNELIKRRIGGLRGSIK